MVGFSSSAPGRARSSSSPRACASGSWQRCAEHLHVHVNTLRYRLQRVEQLTGHSLATLHDRVDFVLALGIR
ncbi:helix-turn-helix domain-containing protein [Streptomyces sp. SM10]|uniref:helix-turn-helix domain-containing protein n=1 Tax=Streptomyces sp. SM10 TaxID=565556 RepID=UPI000CDAE999